MPLTREQKATEVDAVKALIAGAKSLVVADYKGLTVGDMTELRRRCRASEVNLRISKNTLVKLALDGTGMEGLSEVLSGPSAIAYGLGEPSAPAKILMDFAKEKEALKVKGGAVEGQVLGMDRIEYMARLGTREEVLAKVLGGIQAPATNIAMSLLGIHRKLLGLMTAYKEKLEAA